MSIKFFIPNLFILLTIAYKVVMLLIMELNRRTNKQTAMSDWGHAMFSNKSADELYHYGVNLFTVNSEDLVNIANFKNKIIAKFDSAKKFLDLDQITPEEFYDLFDPSDIVDTAKAWDDDKFIEWFSDNIDSSANGYLLQSGAVVFSESIINKK